MLLRVALVALAVHSACAGYSYKTTWFETKVDHFGYANNDTYKMRILYNDEHFDINNPGPIFFYTGNEGDIESFANNTGLMWDWAPEFKALIVFAEHRFYGKSMPYGPKSYSDVKYFGYLTVEQALADFADFLSNLKRTWPGTANSKVVAFGGSYGGMLSAWMRIKYPWIIDAALAASAPILQFQGITPCEVYNQVVTKAFRVDGGDKCAENVRKSWIALDAKGRAGDNGANFIRDNFRICQSVLPANYTVVRDWLYDTYGNLAMMNYPYETSFLKKVPGHPVKVACSYLQQDFASDEELLFGIYKAMSVFHNFTGDSQCNDIGNNDNLGGDDGWNMQTCNEMVMPFCGNGKTDMFYEYAWNFDEFRATCEKKFHMTPDLFKAQTTFGGVDIASASNIIFSNGDVDPWSGGGVLKQLSASLPVIMIKGGAHHYDLRPAHPQDTADVISARNVEKQFIKQWINAV